MSKLDEKLSGMLVKESVSAEKSNPSNAFHKKVLEARIKQSNRKWIVKEIWITVLGGIALYLFVKLLF